MEPTAIEIQIDKLWKQKSRKLKKFQIACYVLKSLVLCPTLSS